ncbi:low temperature requirement protein A [Dactylosporangium sp. NPDC005572]|uniref:low temperature requirement protein A n=1 Tax=Dactylosporangium sp. NPDC005572 TaxID=3156889 RepID=UPI0033BC784C
MTTQEHAAPGKRVSWVELYFDLVFVFAVSQVAHVMVGQPDAGAVFGALGLFATLWFTWIGFVLLYNRRGDDRRLVDRLVILAGTVPCAIAATQAHHAFEHHAAGFAVALAGARVVLAAGYLLQAERRAALAYLVSALVFAASTATHGAWTYVLWGLALGHEIAVVLLRGGREQLRTLRRSRQEVRDLQERRRERLEAQITPPADRAVAVDAAHLAERFGLFMIILLGEVVISVGGAALDRGEEDLGYWLSLGGGLVLAGALWWIYFHSMASLNERLLVASGGNPSLAHTLYASGHLMPAFALLVVAAGVNLSLHDDPPKAAAWLVTAGLAAYLAGTRVLAPARRHWYGGLVRMLVLGGTACLALLANVLVTPAVVAVAAGWAVLVAVAVTLTRPALDRFGDDPLAFLR